MRIPGYEFTNVGSLANDPLLDVVHGLILHVDGGNATSLVKWFDGPSQGIESHVFITKDVKNPNEQFRDTSREADANYKANSWIGSDGKRHGFLSAETQGTGAGKWNKKQLDDIKELILITSKEHDFPLRKVGSYHGHGIGYHTQFPEWTNVPGKTCPGKDRIVQYNEVILPWLAEQKDTRFYITKKDDTVPGICAKFKIEQWQLWRWNPGTFPPFAPGTKLRVKP